MSVASLSTPPHVASMSPQKRGRSSHHAAPNAPKVNRRTARYDASSASPTSPSRIRRDVAYTDTQLAESVSSYFSAARRPVAVARRLDFGQCAPVLHESTHTENGGFAASPSADFERTLADLMVLGGDDDANTQPDDASLDTSAMVDIDREFEMDRLRAVEDAHHLHANAVSEHFGTSAFGSPRASAATRRRLSDAEHQVICAETRINAHPVVALSSGARLDFIASGAMESYGDTEGVQIAWLLSSFDYSATGCDALVHPIEQACGIPTCDSATANSVFCYHQESLYARCVICDACLDFRFHALAQPL